MAEVDATAETDAQLEDMITGAAAEAPTVEAAGQAPPQEQLAKQALDGTDVNVKNTELHVNTHV